VISLNKKTLNKTHKKRLYTKLFSSHQMALIEKHGTVIATTCLTTALAGAGIYYFYKRNIRQHAVLTKVDQITALLDQPNCHIKDVALLREKLRHFVEAGGSRFQIITDFDRTLSKHKVDGLTGHSSYGVIEDSSYIPAASVEKLNDLKNKYFPIEMDTAISEEEKIPLMIQWFTKAFDVAIDAGIQRMLLPAMVRESRSFLRDGTYQFFHIVEQYNIPLLILSAGIGDVIEEILKQQARKPPQTKIVANYYKYDKNGIVTGFKGDLIHTFNKNGVSKMNKEYFDNHKKCTNVLLFGDSLGDPAMADGVDNITSVIKVGFLNDNIEESMDAYLSAYDIVLTDDSSMDVINVLLQQLIQ